VPRAAVVFPLPGPVKTMINPFLASGNAKPFPVLELRRFHAVMW
jgi:hypothetical protein